MPPDSRTGKDELVVLASEAVAKLLVGARQNVTNCRIRVMQFGTNLLYLPAYLLLAEIESYWNSNWTCCPLTVEYINCKTDEIACEQVRDYPAPCPAPWSREQESILTIGLSEIPDDLRKDHWFIEFPFVKRLPLWGLALRNNPKINSLKKMPRVLSGAPVAAGVDDSRAIRREYWKVFGGKLSLLKVADLVDPNLRLGISLYKRGTTAHRLFHDSIKRLNRSVSFTSEVTFKNEFDDLFSGIVDVALTVQPWQAVRRAAALGCDLETVYVHQGRPEPFTSCYCRAPSDWYDRKLLEIALKALHLGVQENIARLYELDDSQSVSWLDVLTEVEGRANVASGEDIDAQTKIGNFSVNDMNCALHLISDSRIYYYDTVNMSETDSANCQKQVEGSLKYYADLRDGILNRGDGADSISTATRLVASLPDLHTHTSNSLKTVAARNEKYKRAIDDLMAIYERYKSHMKPITEDTSCQNFSDQWRCVKIEQLLPRLALASKSYTSKTVYNKLVADDWWRDDDGDDYTFWFDHQILKEALNHFDSQLVADGSLAVDCCAGVLKAGVEGLAWAWITYNSKEITKAPSKWHFAKDNIANRLLHGWFVSGKYQMEKHPQPWHLFNRNHSAGFEKSGDTLQLTFAAQKVDLSMSGADHGFLFTFGVVKKGIRDDEA